MLSKSPIRICCILIRAHHTSHIVRLAAVKEGDFAVAAVGAKAKFSGSLVEQKGTFQAVALS